MLDLLDFDGGSDGLFVDLVEEEGLLGADFFESGPENSMGKEVKLEAGGFEAAEVGVQGGEGKTGADGEGCEVCVHPDFGRSGMDGGEFEPEITRAFGFGIEAVDVRLGAPTLKHFHRPGIGDRRGIVAATDRRGGQKAEEGMLNGAREVGWIFCGSLTDEFRSDRVMWMPFEVIGQP
jgi:hypothetical protein